MKQIKRYYKKAVALIDKKCPGRQYALSELSDDLLCDDNNVMKQSGGKSLVTKPKIHIPFFLIICLLIIFGTDVIGAGTVRGDESAVEDETCLACHDDQETRFASGPHQLASLGGNETNAVMCVSCHSGGEGHIDDPGPENIGNPVKQFSATTQSICSECHAPHLQSGVAGFDPHLNQDISCTDCHAIHSGYEGQLLDVEAGFCNKCHVAVVGQFRSRSNHPLTDEAVTCLSCHNVAGSNDVSLGHGSDANCAACHPEHSGPYLYEHEATSSFATDGDGCIGCHQPHGSANERLLSQPGNGLCRQCHGVPPKHTTTHSGLATQFDCIDCHTQVHGSYDNRVFLDPQMDIKIGDQPGSCYCHELNEF